MKITVTKGHSPILTAGIMRADVLSKDSLWAYHPVVVRSNDGYAMIYTGKQVGRGIQHYTLLATSTDLMTWRKNGEVLKKGVADEWDSDFTAHGFIVKEKNGYSMLYDGSKNGDWLEEIGLAKSIDLVTWKKHPHNPIYKVDPESWWEWRHVSRCCILNHQGYRYMFYAGHDGTRERIGIARGKSLISLKRIQNEPVLDVGRKGTWDEKSISDPRVIVWNKRFIMLYSGIDRNGVERTGAAISSDLISWRKYRENPILDVSKDGWDKLSASRASLIEMHGKYYLFYSGKSTLFYHIGMAEVHIT